MWWMKNTNGKPDAILTMTVAGFAVILVKVLLGGVTLAIAGNEIVFGTIDAASIGALLTPTLGAYVARRYTDGKFTSQQAVQLVTPPAPPPDPWGGQTNVGVSVGTAQPSDPIANREEV